MIKKRDGRQVPFNIEKIASAIYKAAQVVGGNDYGEAMKLADEVQGVHSLPGRAYQSPRDGLQADEDI